MDFVYAVFLVVYLAMALGHLPGFRVDRTGAALLGAMALIVAERISTKAAWAAIDYGTIVMLFGLMVVSSAFTVSGFYAWTARRVATLKVSPPALLAVMTLFSAALSALLTNDVVVIAVTPLLVTISLARGLNPIPFLLAVCFAANAGAAGTLLGSPQNIIIAQGFNMTFLGFMKVAGLPALLSLPIIWAVLSLMYRGRWTLPTPSAAAAAESTPALHLGETLKAAIITVAVVLALIFTSWPQELIALGGASVLLLSRRVASADLLKEVDGNLLLLLIGLFVVNGALAATHLPETVLADLRQHHIHLDRPIPLFLISSLLSNIVGNNPAVMLLVPYLTHAGNLEALGAALALGTGFSSNLIVFGSLAGIIVVEQSARRGVPISFGEFARAGVPVGLATMAMALAWIWLLTL